MTQAEWDETEKATVSRKDAAIAIAKSLGCEDAVRVFESAAAVGPQNELSVILPAGRLEAMSKGKGWARLGNGDSAVWGVKTEGGYTVNKPGNWIVGSNDGFSRKREDSYKVTRVKIGEIFWVVAIAA